MLEPVFQENPKLTHLLQSQTVADELKKSFDALKRVCTIGIESDSTIPSMDATLGWIKSLATKELPTSECKNAQRLQRQVLMGGCRCKLQVSRRLS